jgi:acyl-CoA synthetase (AMP-forming)/AMP-acid ligase II
MSSSPTVLERVYSRAAQAPGSIALSDVTVGGKPVTYAELASTASQAAAGLRALGVTRSDRVMLVLPNGPEFAGLLLGCVGAGAIAVPAPTPTGTRRRAFEDRLTSMTEDCSPRLLVTADGFTRRVAAVLAGRGARVVTWNAVLGAAGASDPHRGHAARPDEPLLLQYTSGSTGRPKGVVVTHAMADAQCAQARRAYAETPDDVAVTWVPLYHDMGLISGVLRPLHAGYHSVLMDPREFIARPRAWLDAIHMYRATLSSAPNFAYDYCVRKIPLLEPTDPLDLSSWRVARNAGEVIRPATADRFSATFGRAGFRAASFCPSYGMAEATLTIATCGPGVPPRRATTEQGETVVSSGVPLPGTRVAVRGDEGATEERRVGELWVKGPQVCSRYWPDRAAQTAEGWLRTRDLGFVDGGHVFVLGRADDTVIVNGRNFFWHDVHEACLEIEGLRPGRSIAVKAPLSCGADEVVWLIGEIAAGSDTADQSLTQTAAEVREVVFSKTGLAISVVGLLPPGTMPLTTSGKAQVGRVRDRLVAGSLPLIWRG